MERPEDLKTEMSAQTPTEHTSTSLNLATVLQKMLSVSDKVSDLIFSPGRPPQIELVGKLQPVEIPGVVTMTFLRTALNAQRKARGESEFSTPAFLKKVREVAAKLNIPQDMLKRGVNVGFSGGEKKRNEILQMALFEPSLCILDEMDSGLDIDALRIAADGVNALRSPDRAMVVITHYQRLLNYIVPDFVHVMSRGRVVKSGDKELALELEASGYTQFDDAA